MEEWKIIKEYPNYQISNFGNIKNITKNKLMSTFRKKSGYIVVKLSKNNIAKECKVHRLVATEFIDNPTNLKFVNHKDEIKSHNHVNNLEWCDSSYNNTYGTKCIRQANKLKIPVSQYSVENILIKTFNSVNEAGKETNINPSSISNCLKKRQKTTGGFIWKYYT